MKIEEKILYYRKNAGLSQEELGQMLLVSRQTVSLWENGQTVPTIDNLIRLSEIFEVSLDELFDRVSTTGAEESNIPYAVQYKAVPVNDDLRRALNKRAVSHTMMAIIISLLSIALAILAFLVYGIDSALIGALLGALLALAPILFTRFLIYSRREKIFLNSFKEYTARMLKIKGEKIFVTEKRGNTEEIISIANCKNTRCAKIGENFEISTSDTRVYISADDGTNIIPTVGKASKAWQYSLTTYILLLVILILFFTGLTVKSSMTEKSALDRFQHYTGIDIPNTTSISKNTDIGIRGNVYIKCVSEAYFSSDEFLSFENQISKDDRFIKTEKLYSPLLSAFDTYELYSGAEYAVIFNEESGEYNTVSDSTGGYIAVFCYIDEDMLRIVEFEKNNK